MSSKNKACTDFFPLKFLFSQGILINGQFPGPTLECVTNDNIIINVVNKLDEPILITWSVSATRTNTTEGT